MYALFGLLRVAEIVTSTPDYNMTVADVYKQIATLAIFCSRGLDVLELKPWNQDDCLPSWVVDMSKLLSLQLPGPQQCPWQRHPSLVDSSDTTIIPSNPDDVAQLEVPNCLKISGAIIDQVATVHIASSCVRQCLGQPQ